MINLCTLFDSNYLSRGLAMYRSLVDTGETFTLYVVCFDDLAFRALGKLNLPGLVAISLPDFESDELKRVKPQRNRAEYCWTCTPHVIRYVLDNFGLTAVTYLDADLYFYAQPTLLLEELEKSGGSVLITGHNYSPRYAHLLPAGIYCVQFLTVKADQRGMKVLSWWQERCLEWCYDRVEDGKFGDQKYLDCWPGSFEGVHVLEHPGGGVAPWNVQQFRIALRDGKPFASQMSEAHEFPVVFYHFHHIRFYNNGFLELGHYALSREVKRFLYRPYLEKLAACKNEVAGTGLPFDPDGPVPPARGFIKALGRLQRRLQGNYLPYRKFCSMR